MATLPQWIEGARPRTLPAAVAPVILGTGAAAGLDRADVALALLALLVALLLQVGVNYANDYSDGVRGTDTARVGPVRLVGQRLADPRNVKFAAFASFGAAAVVGLALVALSNTPVLLLFGAAAIIAAWRYTGGANPYGYRGLGEIYVFVFFGLFATLGTLYTQAHRLSVAGLLGAIGVGSIATGLLVANNLRDVYADRVSGKRTLAVRLGPDRTRVLYIGLLTVALLAVVAMAVLVTPWAALGLLSAPLAWRAARTVWSQAMGADLIPVLLATGLFEVAYAVLTGIGLALAAAIGS
ncbi:MAG: 1,4-dihydroxy-2-naphthoate polyprenyltransferase [Nostocoides sp.]